MVISNKCRRKAKEVSGKTLKETKKKKGHQGYPCLSLFISDFTILKVQKTDNVNDSCSQKCKLVVYNKVQLLGALWTNQFYIYL